MEEQSNTPDHLTPIITERGFKHLPEIHVEDRGVLRVYESSSYDPSIWLTAEGFVDDGPGAQERMEKVFLSLSLEEAEQLRDQLTFLVENHFTKG